MWGWVFNTTPRPPYPQERDLVPVVLDAGWAPGLAPTGIIGWTLGPGKLAVNGIPARSKLLYRLSYPSPQPSLCENQNGNVKEI
jgi:hypothetical protein